MPETTEAIAAKFTSPVHRCDKWGETEWVENPEPADRVDQSPRIVFTAGDGHPSFRTPTCAELGEAVAVFRDEEVERLREERDQAIARVRDLAEEWKATHPDVFPPETTR